MFVFFTDKSNCLACFSEFFFFLDKRQLGDWSVIFRVKKDPVQVFSKEVLHRLTEVMGDTTIRYGTVKTESRQGTIDSMILTKKLVLHQLNWKIHSYEIQFLKAQTRKCE